MAFQDKSVCPRLQQAKKGKNSERCKILCFLWDLLHSFHHICAISCILYLKTILVLFPVYLMWKTLLVLIPVYLIWNYLRLYLYTWSKNTCANTCILDVKNNTCAVTCILDVKNNTCAVTCILDLKMTRHTDAQGHVWCVRPDLQCFIYTQMCISWNNHLQLFGLHSTLFCIHYHSTVWGWTCLTTGGSMCLITGEWMCLTTGDHVFSRKWLCVCHRDLDVSDSRWQCMSDIRSLDMSDKWLHKTNFYIGHIGVVLRCSWNGLLGEKENLLPSTVLRSHLTISVTHSIGWFTAQG